MTARVYYGPPRDLAAEPLRDFDDVVGIVTGRAVIALSGKRWTLLLIPGHPRPVVGELWQRLAELGVDLEVVGGRWLVEVDRNDCGGCLGPYGCPPGSHESLVRELTWRATS